MKSEREINSYERKKKSVAVFSVLLLQITKNSHSPLKKKYETSMTASKVVH